MACTFFISPYRFRHTEPKTTTKTQIYWEQQDQRSHLNPNACSLCLHLPWGFQEEPEAPGRGNSYSHTGEKQRETTEASNPVLWPQPRSLPSLTGIKDVHFYSQSLRQPASFQQRFSRLKVFIAAISSQRREKKKKPWTPTRPGTAQAEQPQAGSCYPRKREFREPPAPAAHYVLDWVVEVSELQSVFHGSGYPLQLFWVFLPSRMGMATASAEGLSAFKQPQLPGEWKPLPPTSNTVEKVHCRAGSFVFLFALWLACKDRGKHGVPAWWFWWRIKTQTHLTALILQIAFMDLT